MKNICKKIIVFSLIFFMIFVSFQTNRTYAIDKVMSSGKSFLDSADRDTPLDEAKLQETSSYIYNILFIAAIVIAFAIGIIIGIQFIIGTVDDKAKVKETLVPYVVGVVVVFGAFGIWKFAMSIGNSFENAKIERNKSSIIRMV